MRAFSKEELNEDLACLKICPIPLKYWVEELDKEFWQAWFDGAQLIVDNQFKDFQVALCAQSYWKEMRIVISRSKLYGRQQMSGSLDGGRMRRSWR